MSPKGAVPGIVAVELRAARALVTLKLGQLVAAPALLAEALQLALAHELRQADVHIADAIPEVVSAQLGHVPGAVFHLNNGHATPISNSHHLPPS